MMGSDVGHDAWDCEIHRAGIQAMRQRAAELRAELCASRGLTPSQACSVGCQVCGVIDASPARCEQCTGVHTAAPARQSCYCGPDGCADSACPGLVRMTPDGYIIDTHRLPADDSEGGLL
ncbi:MAG: hypothetical protein RLY71_2306 [Pseudomonadota bacterium]|jgi:hypothetical protein